MSDRIVIGYEDRFVGVLEIDFNDYLESDIKDHRIKYFRLDNEILWDKELKLDNFEVRKKKLFLLDYIIF